MLYVDAQSGSDSNSGSSSSPLKTIQAAVNKANTNNQKSIGTKIVVNAGVYRETVNIDPVSGLTSPRSPLRAASNGAAIISASDAAQRLVARSTVLRCVRHQFGRPLKAPARYPVAGPPCSQSRFTQK